MKRESTGVCPHCKGDKRDPMEFDYACPICHGEGKLWCAMCGTYGDHRSGKCPELKEQKDINE